MSKIDFILSIARGMDGHAMRKPMVFEDGHVKQWYDAESEHTNVMYCVYGMVGDEQGKAILADARTFAKRYWQHPCVIGVATIEQAYLLEQLSLQ